MPTLIERGTIGLPNSATKQEKEKARTYIAKDYIVERVLDKFEPEHSKHWTDRVLILIAGTGSGKSVTIPPEVYMALRASMHRNVITTQPRTVSAIRTVQEDIQKWYPLKIGKDLGYQTSAITKKPIKGLLYATIGVLLQQLKIMETEMFMRKYGVIIIDEAHERSLETDMTMGFLKKVLVENWQDPYCPFIILMSATLELDRFTKYWGEKSKTPEVINVVGKTYPIDEHFLPADAGNYMWKIVEIVKEIHKNEEDFDSDLRDVLIFLHSESQIDKMIEILGGLNAEFTHKIYPAKFTSGVYKNGGKPLQLLESPISKLKINGVAAKRKVIVATNVAETSLTIETLKYVIDSGFRTAVEFDPNGFHTIVNKSVTQDMAKQRKGRVGRVAPGHWYPIYTEETYNEFQEAKFPDVITGELTQSLLSMIVRDGKYGEFALMDPLPNDSLHYSLRKLYTIGAIKFEGSDIVPSELGLMINRFRKVSVENIRMILAGYHYGANILDLVTISALISSDKIKRRGYKMKEVFTRAEDAIYLNDSFIDLIFLFEDFCSCVFNQGIAKAKKFCEDRFVSYEALLNIIDVRDELIEDMVGIVGFDPLYNGLQLEPSKYSLFNILRNSRDIGIDEVAKIKRCIYDGYRMNIATYNSQSGYYEYLGRAIERPDVIGTPKYLTFGSMVLMGFKGKYKYRIDNFSVIDNYIIHDPYLI